MSFILGSLVNLLNLYFSIQVWLHHIVGHFCLLGFLDSEYPVPDGGSVRLPPHPEVALGGVSVQVLQGRRLRVRAILLQVHSEAGRIGLGAIQK